MTARIARSASEGTGAGRAPVYLYFPSASLLLLVCTCLIPLVVTASSTFQKDPSAASVNGPLCPRIFSPSLAHSFPGCPAQGQCSENSTCRGSTVCCSSFRLTGNSTQPGGCVGLGCVCRNLTALCPTLNCGGKRQKIDSSGCSICECETATLPGSSSTAVPSISTTGGWITGGQTSGSVKFALIGNTNASEEIAKNRSRFDRALSEQLTYQFNLTFFGKLENLTVEFLCCTAEGNSYLPVYFDLACASPLLFQLYSDRILTAAHSKRISFIFRTDDGGQWQLTSGYLISDSTPTPPMKVTTTASVSQERSIIIYACSGVGGILVVIIIVMVIVLCKRSKSGGVEFYEDPAPGVRFDPSSGVLDQTINTAYPAQGKSSREPQLVFDQPLYEANRDTENLVARQ
ncbi:uncharacterized protein LOC135823957 [Sycon ciliatum]|uniref:uncharacterized protein LOC135823957 n=1 Tax=Sycon ciliatum TaxID=27933 RepID=UPI0031F69636